MGDRSRVYRLDMPVATQAKSLRGTGMSTGQGTAAVLYNREERVITIR